MHINSVLFGKYELKNKKDRLQSKIDIVLAEIG